MNVPMSHTPLKDKKKKSSRKKDKKKTKTKSPDKKAQKRKERDLLGTDETMWNFNF